ncbi:hypothetical protein L3Q82_012406 [Scortum barcoo]|uniref:Uncharacterized protein n=1 Tax=Scortum barcoo TaxID=214431 RepID=A0ACB8W3Q3_9TELE|nr:hypothetical protein L3Q82_012406 [Scortum barcoo]
MGRQRDLSTLTDCSVMISSSCTSVMTGSSSAGIRGGGGGVVATAESGCLVGSSPYAQDPRLRTNWQEFFWTFSTCPCSLLQFLFSLKTSIIVPVPKKSAVTCLNDTALSL